MLLKDKELSWAHPLVREWFLSKFGTATEPQVQGWPSILARNSTLISAPTGSGKTLAAFLICIDQLIRLSLRNELIDNTYILYVSPLKALSNDIQKNLQLPLAEIYELARQQGYTTLQEVRIAVRSGDTPNKDRQAMLKKPPHILVTTPESLYILLTAVKSREILKSIHTVIVDEIHALANDKRGAHLSLSLERLQAIVVMPLLRIGLSATQKPMEMVAKFLVGNKRPLPKIVNIGYAKQLDLAVVIPRSELGSVASNEMWDEIYDQLASFALQNRSTLIFVNTRRLAERVAHHLTERLGDAAVAAHHGSLSRKLRLAAETKLKHGELKALIATASLELGIDVGAIDLVCQIGSPRAIAVALQRIGRAGHWRGAISKGRIFATTRDELLECAALVYAITEGDLDQLIIPQQPLDILAQQIVASVATNDWHEDELFALVSAAYPYADLSRETFNKILEMLAEGISGTRGRYSAYLFRDTVNGLVKARRGSRITAITNGGAIPDNGLFTVIAEPDGTVVGSLDEDFAIESNRGDIILLGTTSWKIKRIESIGRVIVEDAHGSPPNVPFWRGEAPARSNELSAYVSKLRLTLTELLQGDECQVTAAIAWLQHHCRVDAIAAKQLIEYLLQGRAVLGAVPTQKTVIAERFFDESGGMQLIIHAPFGARINKAWGLALRKRFCRSFNFELQAAATDNGLTIALAEQHSFPLGDVFHFLNVNTIKEVLIQAVLQSPLFTTRWRWDATRALALLRFRFGKKVPPQIQRMLSDDLLASVFPDAAACQDNLGGRDIELPNHPLINETMKDCLHEALDLAGLTKVLRDVNLGNIKCVAVDTPLASVFSHEILNANPYAFLDDAPLEERRARAVELRRVLPESILKEIGCLDPNAIAEVQRQAWPDVRNEDELHDCLQTFIAFPSDFIRDHHDSVLWQSFFNKLLAANRVAVATYHHKTLWLAIEKASIFKTIYPDAVGDKELIEEKQRSLDYESAVCDMIKGWLFHLGPTTAHELSEYLELNPEIVAQTLLKLEASGLILRGHFRNVPSDTIEWCERRLLARIHRLTLGTLRKEIQAISASQFMRWLLQWHHLAPGTQLKGERGLLEVIKQLQGFEIPANAWERDILAKRISDYDSSLLERLCLTGHVAWGRLSPHPALEPQQSRRIIPTSITPITFFLRDEADWISRNQRFLSDTELLSLSLVAQHIYAYLKECGASFFSDIARGVSHLKSEIETGLWELVAAGLVTSDGFDNCRALIDPRRRAGIGRRRNSQARHGSGRWALLHTVPCSNQVQQLESVCWLLLKRYGVVFRDLLVRETILPRWRELLVIFRRLEARGEIRGGRFVDGFVGEQFALPYAVDSLRATTKKLPTNELLTISAVDPLNLIGIILPGNKITAISGNSVTLPT